MQSQPKIHSSAQKQQTQLSKLSSPQTLQYTSKKTRSKTNHQMYPSQSQRNNSNKNYKNNNQNQQINTQSNQNNTKQVKKKSRNYSKSFAIIKPIINHSLQKASINSIQKDNQQKQYNLTTNNPSQYLRSKVFSTHTITPPEQLLPKFSPYDKFIKQLNIQLPTPQQKFKQFVEIAPFNRLKNHTDFISHILQKQSVFFRIHPSQIVDDIAKKIVQIQPQQFLQNWVIVLHEGSCTYQGKKIQKGQLVTRHRFIKQDLHYEGTITFIGLPKHQYSTFVSQYLNNNMIKYKKFIESIQIFKIFTQQAIQKIFSSLILNFYSKGQNLYQIGQSADNLYLICSGSAARKIIVQIDKTNKIPLQKYSKLVKVLSRSYQHRIRFKKQDLVGVADIIDNIQKRSQDIIIDQDAIVLSIDRIAIEQNLDQYIIDRLRKYNMRKYPKNYDELCDNYLKQKIENRKAEQRKIAALKDQINRDSNNQRKGDKINNIIKIYQKRIKEQEKQHLVDRKKMERIVHNDN